MAETTSDGDRMIFRFEYDNSYDHSGNWAWSEHSGADIEDAKRDFYRRMGRTEYRRVELYDERTGKWKEVTEWRGKTWTPSMEVEE